LLVIAWYLTWNHIQWTNTRHCLKAQLSIIGLCMYYSRYKLSPAVYSRCCECSG